MINILLADDHGIVRNGLKNLLEKEPDIQIIGEATNGIEAMQLANTVKPHIILADMNMPGMDGIKLTEKLRTDGSPAKVILLTMHDHQQHVNKAIKAGVAAYLFKNISAEELVFAIKQVHAGKQYLCAELSMRLLSQIMTLPIHLDEENNRPANFSDREHEILRLMADGLTNQEIADRIFTSKRTVEGHRRAMIESAGVKNTASLIRFAMRKKLIE